MADSMDYSYDEMKMRMVGIVCPKCKQEWAEHSLSMKTVIDGPYEETRMVLSCPADEEMTPSDRVQ